MLLLDVFPGMALVSTVTVIRANLETSGNLLYTNSLVLFPVSSLILLVAMIGAIVPTMHKTTKVKRHDVFQQNAIDFRKTIRKILENKQMQSLAAKG